MPGSSPGLRVIRSLRMGPIAMPSFHRRSDMNSGAVIAVQRSVMHRP